MNAADVPLGAYVHFPWCVRKCPYCDFNSHPVRGTLDESGYAAALAADWHAQLPAAGGRSPHTVFLGGGTPSLMSGTTIGAVLALLNVRDGADPASGVDEADLAGRTNQGVTRVAVEVTLEANPGTTEHDRFGAYLRAGVNRLSLGAQSFDDVQLATLGRIHKSADTHTAYRLARRAGFANINLDLMYALPQQTVVGALADLRAAIDLQPEHISWYQLTIEPKTEFARRPPALPDESVCADIEAAGRELLEASGYARYEVSAWARPERQCAHNLNYWQFGDYLGIGAGAHGKLTQPGRVTRSAKPNPPRLYLNKPTDTPWRDVPAADLAGEFMLNALRLRTGVPLELFAQRTGLPWAAVAKRWDALVARGLVHSDRIRTTDTGYRFLDTVVGGFFD